MKLYLHSGNNQYFKIDQILFGLLGCSYKSFQHQMVNLQATRCSSVQVNEFNVVCDNPIISYGSVDGGIPQADSNTDYDKWCTEMGLGEFVSVTVSPKPQKISKPYGWVYGCTDHDDSNWHWCDLSNGKWLEDRELGFSENQNSYQRVTKLFCRKGNIVPECTIGKW